MLFIDPSLSYLDFRNSKAYAQDVLDFQPDYLFHLGAFTDLEYTAFLTGEDMDGKKLDSPESIVIDSASFNYYNLSQYAHLFKWTPRDVDKGSHTLLIKLTDSFGFTAYHRHNFTVFSKAKVYGRTSRPRGEVAVEPTNWIFGYADINS